MGNPAGQDLHTPPTPSTPEPTVSVNPKPRMCLKRKEDHYVPLIAVDELPSWIKLKAVPMTLRGEDALGLGMMICGEHPKLNNDCYQVELNEIPAEIHTCNVLEESQACDSSISPHSSTATGETLMTPDKNGDGSKTSLCSAEKEKADVNGNQTKIAGSKLHSSVSATSQGAPGTFGKKIYCTFWCRTGNCNYTQQGCKFLHEIPPDLETRLAIGLRDYPTWMREDPTPPPKPAKASPANRLQEATWRRGMTHDSQRELPESPSRGHGRTLSNIAAPVPYSGLVQMPSLIQAPTMTPTNTGAQASDPRILNLYKLQATQQAALFLPQQQYFPSSTDSLTQTLPQRQISTFDGANGNTTFQSTTPAGQERSRFQSPTNGLFSNATILGTNERRPVPATQPPISRPALSPQALSTSPRGKDSTNTTIYMPGQNTTDASPQASTRADSNTTHSAHAMKDNQKAFATNGSVHSTSRACAPVSSNANNAAAGNGTNQTLSSLVDGSTASPRVMHRRLFVPPGEPQYMPNPIEAASSKSQQRSRSRKGANGKGRGYGAGKAGQSAKAQGQWDQEEDLVLL